MGRLCFEVDTGAGVVELVEGVSQIFFDDSLTLLGYKSRT
jgi:hypothetical protein